MAEQIWFRKYRIIKLLGRGGSAQVYLAEHLKLKTLRAIKQISKDNILYEQLLNEAHILKNLKHPCIPVIYDFEEDAHNSYIIEQYIEGESLKVLRERQNRLFKETLIINFAVQICDLLQYLYSLDNPILYLDLKPENIIIADNEVKLIDFGASGFKNRLKDRKYSLGTKGYAAPELYTGHMPDERTDIYGIGSLLYYMVTGTVCDRQLLTGNRKDLLRPCSKPLRRVIHRSLRYNPVLRYSSVPVLKNKLSGINRKNLTGNSDGGKATSIAVAGTQHRIGTTHLAILIAAYLNEPGQEAFYMEKNDSNHILEALNQYRNIKTADGFYRLYNCNIIPAGLTEAFFTKGERPVIGASLVKGEQPVMDTSLVKGFIKDDRQTTGVFYAKGNHQVTVIDYGCIHEGNLEDFCKADIRLVVAGAREWELGATKEALRLLRGEKQIRYLFNFLDGNQFRIITKHMDGLDCRRIPYEPCLFKRKRNEYLEDFIKDLING